MLAHDGLNGMLVAPTKMLFVVVQPWMLLLRLVNDALQFTASDGNGGFEVAVMLFGGGEESVQSL